MSNPNAEIIAAAEGFRRDLLRRERDAASALARAYGVVWREVRDRLDRLMKEAELRASGITPDVAWLMRRERLESLQAQTEQQVAQFARDADPLIQREQREAVALAQAHAPQLVLPLLPPQRVSVGVVWNRVPQEAITSLVGFLRDGSPLSSVLDTLGPLAAEGMKKALIAGIGTGQNPREIARLARQELGVPLTRALTIARTETLRAYREASRESYLVNDDVVKGWRWLCDQSPRTCPACLAMDGTEFPLNEPMGTHPNCRCTMVPITRTWEELGFEADANDEPPPHETGADWFDRQSEQVQDTVLGKAAGAAFRKGEVTLSDFVGEKRTRRWGVTRYTQSLKDALQAQKSLLV